MSAGAFGPGPEPPVGARILVSRLRFLGDIILSLPLLRALRAARPDVEIHYLAEAPGLELLRTQPEVDVRWQAPHGFDAGLVCARALHAQHFAAAIDLFCNPRSALLIRATGAPIRIGEDRRIRRHAYTLARHLVPGKSAIEQHLDALGGLGIAPPPPTCPVLELGAETRAAGIARWRERAGTPAVLVHLGATQVAKEWPEAPATDFVRAVEAEFGAVLSTAPNRPAPSAAVARAVPGVRLLPPAGLREFLGLVAAARAVVTVDGAVAHAAVALGRPTVALFGPTDPAVWFPYAAFGPYRVVHARTRCEACAGGTGAHDCMGAISVESVLAALRAVVRQGSEVPWDEP